MQLKQYEEKHKLHRKHQDETCQMKIDRSSGLRSLREQQLSRRHAQERTNQKGQAILSVFRYGTFS